MEEIFKNPETIFNGNYANLNEKYYRLNEKINKRPRCFKFNEFKILMKNPGLELKGLISKDKFLGIKNGKITINNETFLELKTLPYSIGINYDEEKFYCTFDNELIIYDIFFNIVKVIKEKFHNREYILFSSLDNILLYDEKLDIFRDI